MVALRLARAGYWGGDPGRVKRAPVGDVMAAMEYENFCIDYEAASFELQKQLAG